MLSRSVQQSSACENFDGRSFVQKSELELPAFLAKLKSMWKETLAMRAFGWAKIPLLAFCSPSVLEINSKRCEVKLPLGWRTKNHLGSMYFGALAVGADCAGGLIAFRMIQNSGAKVSLVFKDFTAQFHKRPEADVHFICEDGEAITALVRAAEASEERQNLAVKIRAVCPSISTTDVVADFVLTLSLKKKTSKSKA